VSLFFLLKLFEGFLCSPVNTFLMLILYISLMRATRALLFAMA
jgi:hypothetical protein